MEPYRHAMLDQQLIDKMDFLHETGLGRGGYKILLPPMLLFDDNLILTSFDGEYVNPFGPLKKSIWLYSRVRSSAKDYELSFYSEFWNACPEQNCIEMYIKPLFYLLRNFATEQITLQTIHQYHKGFSARILDVDPYEKEVFPKWLHNAKNRTIQ